MLMLRGTPGRFLPCAVLLEHLTSLSEVRCQPVQSGTPGKQVGHRGTTHLLAVSRVSTFFHSSLFSDVYVSTLEGSSRHRLRAPHRLPHSHPLPAARPVAEDSTPGWGQV